MILQNFAFHKFAWFSNLFLELQRTFLLTNIGVLDDQGHNIDIVVYFHFLIYPNMLTLYGVINISKRGASFCWFTGLIPHSVGDHEHVEKKSGGVWPEGFPIVEGWMFMAFNVMAIFLWLKFENLLTCGWSSSSDLQKSSSLLSIWYCWSTWILSEWMEPWLVWHVPQCTNWHPDHTDQVRCAHNNFKTTKQ